MNTPDDTFQKPAARDFPEWPITDDAIRNAVAAMLADGSWGWYHGPHCPQLRAGLEREFGVACAHLTSSGTAAVELALRAAGVSEGDEVILAAYDYKANFINVLALKAKPVLIDTLPHAPVLNPACIEAAISEKTRAIICSHLHGSCADIERIKSLAQARNLVVIEDACQVSGATIHDQFAGTLGHLGTLSFGGSKLLTAGRGGAVITNDSVLAQRIRVHTHRGNETYPLSEMQAAVLNAQLEQLPERTIQRHQSANAFLDELAVSRLIVPACQPEQWSANTRPGLYKLALLWTADTGRDEFCHEARQNGVALDPGFHGLHRIHAKSRFRTQGTLQNADELHDRLMVLHHPLLLRPEEEVRAAAATLVRLEEQFSSMS